MRLALILRELLMSRSRALMLAELVQVLEVSGERPAQ
jgi:hypothetical protein